MSNFKHIKIDVSKSSKEEIITEISRLKKESSYYKNLEQSIKIILNSMYGVFGNQYFTWFNLDIAIAITSQGVDLIKYTKIILDKYFKEKWHEDTVLHDKLGLTEAQQLDKEFAIYSDTDSLYVQFGEILKNILPSQEGKEIEFIRNIYEFRLTKLLNNAFDLYAESWNTKNMQKFELESISKNGIWLAKKKYIINLAWEDPGIIYEDNSMIKFVGVEIVQSSTPKFVRKYLPDLVKYILVNEKNLKLNYIIQEVKKLKQLWDIQNEEDISMLCKMNDYEKYVISDANGKMKLKSGIPIHTRAAARYNSFMLVNNITKQYPLLLTGDKVKYYYTSEGDNEVFGFTAGTFPYDLDIPRPDMNKMFARCIVDPINRLVVACGYNKIPASLLVKTKLF